MNTILTDDERPKLPEPTLHDGVTISKRGKYTGTTDGYTAEQMEAYADAIEAAVLAKLREQVPVAWQWRKKDQAWSLDRTFNSEVYATTNDSEVRPLYATPQPAVAQDRKALAKSMADKLMGWRLPDTFYPDGYVTFDREAAFKQTASWPVGANLFTHEQAVQMLLDIMPAAPEAPAQGDSAQAAAPILTRDAVYKAIRIAEGLAGSVAMNDREESGYYIARLHDHLMQFVLKDAPPEVPA